MEDNMTDKQFEKILKMVEMILDGCKDLDEAKAKVKELTEDQKKEKSAEQPTGYKQRGGGLATKAPNCLYRYNIKKTWQGQYGGKADGRKQTCGMEPRQSTRGCILSDVRKLD